MGCLKNVTRSIFLTVVIVGFIAFGGNDFIRTQVKNFFNPSHDIVLERAQKIGDFSKINKEFEIEKAAGIFLFYLKILLHNRSNIIDIHIPTVYKIDFRFAHIIIFI